MSPPQVSNKQRRASPASCRGWARTPRAARWPPQRVCPSVSVNNLSELSTSARQCVPQPSYWTNVTSPCLFKKCIHLYFSYFHKMQFMQLLDDRGDTVGSRIIMRRQYVSIKVTSPPPVRNKQVTTQNIDTETITHHRAARPGHPVQRGHRESAPPPPLPPPRPGQ